MPIVALENAWDALKRDLGEKLAFIKERDAPLVQPFRGFGTADEFWVRGRVIEDEGVISAIHSDSLLVNLKHTYKRYETDEIPGAELAWSFGALEGRVTTDEEGYFDFRFAPGDAFDAAAAWQDVHLTLEKAPGYEAPRLGATVRVRTPGPRARLAVISDIDDTIVYTGAHDFAKHWRTVVANSAQSREVYDGVAELYRALVGPRETNPIFYVSSSPWNLFDLFERYMALNEIPLGPMMLKDYGLDRDKWLTGGHDGHKGRQIDRIAGTYPDLPLVLIGDSGQRDAAIYADAAERHAGRVAAVVIHEVTPGKHRAEVGRMRERLAGDVPHLVTDSYPAAQGWLREIGLLDDANVTGAAGTDPAAGA